MDTEYFQHPRRFPKNADGPFYTTGHQARETDSPDSRLVWCGDCLWCEAPEGEAPELLAPLANGNIDTYFIRQPENATEVEHACRAAWSCCVSALRYGGRNHSIINRLENDPAVCDYIVSSDGKLVLTVDEHGELLPFAQSIVDKLRARRQREWRKQSKKWWQFWRSFETRTRKRMHNQRVNRSDRPGAM